MKLIFKGPLVIVMGSEGTGMRQLVASQCDFLAKLPMAGKVSSLNVSVAAGVCFVRGGKTAKLVFVR
jgi:23S rRNA (guanosine2251-2'-O)-methyltransferase